MYQIKLKVNGNGTLTFEQKPRLKLGTSYEDNSVKLVFEIDDSVEGEYHYIKLLNGNLSCLYRVKNNEIVLSKTITSKEGVWLLSFISTNGVIENNETTGNYVFITEPIEAVVVKGILKSGYRSVELETLDKLFSMNFTELVIPEGVTSIGDYFLYNSKLSFAITIGIDVVSIGAYPFYDATITQLKFVENCRLNELKENCFYNLTFLSDVILPKSIEIWGKYCFKNTTGKKLGFEKNSALKNLGSYAIWENYFEEVELPDHLESLSGNTYVIKNCSSLKKIWIPNTITTNIPANAIYGNPVLEEIVLQEGFNVSANFVNCTNLTAKAIEGMLLALKNLNGLSAKSITLGSTNLAKLSESQKAIATNKNWTLS